MDQAKTKDARDPFLGLANLFRGMAKEQMTPWYAEGRVLSVSPLKVRADGMELDADDLYVAQHLTAGWKEQLSGLSWEVSAALPYKRLSGQGAEGSCYVERPSETIQGTTAAAAEVTHPGILKAGDLVLLLRSSDGQTYYLIEKLVRDDGKPVPSD